jgi:hypothetical protein
VHEREEFYINGKPELEASPASSPVGQHSSRIGFQPRVIAGGKFSVALRPELRFLFPRRQFGAVTREMRSFFLLCSILLRVFQDLK